MVGVAGWGPDGGAWSSAHMARAFHKALGVSLHSAYLQKYLDALLYGLTLAWGTEVTSFNLTPDTAAVSLAICDLVSKEPAKSGARKYAGSQTGAKLTPKKQSSSEKNHGLGVDEETKRGEGQVRCDAGARVEEVDVVRPKMTHKEPSYKNAWWLRKRPGSPHWTKKICRLLEDLMEANETEAEADMGAMVYELCKILLDCDKSRKDALKPKIKEHKKKQKHRVKKQRKKERRKEKKGRKSSKRGKGRRGWPESTSSSSESSSSYSHSGSSSSGSSSSSGRSIRRQKDRGGQKGAPRPEFKWNQEIRRLGMLRRAAQKCLPKLRWPPLVVRSGESRVQGPTELTSPGAKGGTRPSLVANGRAPTTRLAVGDGS